VRHQRLAASLAARIGAQLLVDRSDLGLERVDHRERDRDLFTRGLRQRLSRKPLAPVADHQRAPRRAAVVIEHGLDPLLPLAALVRKRVPRTDPRAQIEDVLGRDPRLWQPVDHQQLSQMPGVRAVGLRPLLAALPGAGLRGLGQMHLRGDLAELLDHEPPPCRRLQRNLELLVVKARQEPADAGAIGRCHPPARHLTGRRVDPLRGDLHPMLIKTHHDRHPPTPFPSSLSASSTTRAVTRAASSPTHRIP